MWVFWQSTNCKCTSKVHHVLQVHAVTFIFAAYLHICSGRLYMSWSFFHILFSLGQVVNPIAIAFCFQWKIRKSPAKLDNILWTINDWLYLTMIIWLFMTFPYFSRLSSHFLCFSTFSQVISVFSATVRGRSGAPAFRLKEVYDLSRTTSALSKRVGDPRWRVCLDPKIGWELGVLHN